MISRKDYFCKIKVIDKLPLYKKLISYLPSLAIEIYTFQKKNLSDFYFERKIHTLIDLRASIIH